jgi:tetratricopeptide (TPR) repeat protein
VAILAYDEAIRHNPEDAVVWNNKGFSLGIQGKYEEAIQKFDEAIRLDPELTAAQYNKGKILEALDAGEGDSLSVTHHWV